MRIGQCAHCEAQFEDAVDLEPAPWDPIASALEDYAFEAWVAEQTRHLVAYQATAGITQSYFFGDTLLWWLVTHDYSVQSHGSILGFDFEDARYLFDGDAHQSLGSILEVCWKLDVGVLDFMQRHPPADWKGLQEERLKTRVRRKAACLNGHTNSRWVVGFLEEVLERRLHRTESLVEICAQQLGISTEAPYTHCPEIACKLTERFLRTGRTKEDVRQAMTDWELRQSAGT